MSNTNKKQPVKRSYPQGYEKFIPIALGAIGIAVTILIVIALLVALGLFPGM